MFSNNLDKKGTAEACVLSFACRGGWGAFDMSLTKQFLIFHSKNVITKSHNINYIIYK